MKLSDIGEFGLISRIKTGFPHPEGVVGIGDDCAILPQNSGEDTLVSTDMLVEGTHFLLDKVTPRQLGWKSAAVNISDIAAMGGSPVASFLSLALPNTLDTEWVEAFMAGYKEVSDRFGTALLGGDTTSTPDRLCINVTVLGTCPSGKAKRRNQARPGDVVCVTGTLGDSAGGLKAILEGRDEPELVERHYCPMPRVREGVELAAIQGVHAMMDVSDGIASDLRHILEESGVGAEIDIASLPLSSALKRFCSLHNLDIEELAASGGEDYELLFTAEEGTGLPEWCTIIGRITETPGLRWKDRDRDYMGFRHF